MLETLNHPAIIAAIVIGLLRLCEILYGEANANKMLAQGGVEFAPKQRLPILLIYTAWLLALIFNTPLYVQPDIAWLGVFIILQMLRWWAMAHLKSFWTTRVIILPKAKLVKSGPYRFLPHPVYVALLGEVFALSLAFQQWGAGLFFGGLTALWLYARISSENAALDAVEAA